MKRLVSFVVSVGLTLSQLSSLGSAQTLQDMQLRAAIQDGRRAEAISLLQAGADVNGRTSGGYTPLMLAASAGDLELVKLLLQRGADPTLKNDAGWDAAYLAKINQQTQVLALLQGAAGAAPQQPARPQTTAATVANGARDSHGWPRLGAFQPGQEVLYSGTAGKTWQRGTVTKLDPKFGYTIKEWGSEDPYFVVGTKREPFWTGWFVGDWRVSVPMATGRVTDGRNVYRVVSGGMRLPPLRIARDGTYSWRYDEGRGERLLRGRWVPNPDGPGVILKKAAYGEDWLVYNNTRTGSQLGHTVILSSPKHTYMDGSRL